MQIKTYRADTMQEALAQVREDLGPDAAVLHTRQVRGGRLWRWLPGRRQIEVTASAEVNVPSRLPQLRAAASASALHVVAPRAEQAVPATHGLRDELHGQIDQLQAMVRDLCRQSRSSGRSDVPPELFAVYTDLIEADIAEDLARELVDRVRRESFHGDCSDPVLAKTRVASLIEGEIHVAGPITLVPGRRKVVALVGPTGVGKTTTIAKLAANFRLRERRKVGLITVDTYRIAAVEQLRTYADIMDLPMQVVTTPREMREAVARMSDLDLVLMDTAGRSPRDEVKLHELKSFLGEAQCDEVHLVLSSVAGGSTLERTAERFSSIGATSLVLTKLDEATGLGNLLPLLRNCRLPLSYLTNGQNVPDDIAAADPKRLARMMLDVSEQTV
jgi:flagellar biosynthesis protein FlhF